MSADGIIVSARVVFSREDQVLLVQRSSLNNSNSGKWEIPGGTVEFLEETIPAIKREAKEETGLVIYPSCTTSLTTVSEGPYHVTHVFLCTRFRRSPGVANEIRLSKEHKNYKWVTVEEALDLKLTPITQEVMEFLLE